MTTTLRTVAQPTVVLPSGHFCTLPLHDGGYVATVVEREGENFLVRIEDAPRINEVTVLLYAVDVTA